MHSHIILKKKGYTATLYLGDRRKLELIGPETEIRDVAAGVLVQVASKVKDGTIPLPHGMSWEFEETGRRRQLADPDSDEQRAPWQGEVDELAPDETTTK